MKLQSRSQSQAGQESFVLSALDFKRDGSFVEVGSWHPRQDSNTHLLEKKYGWRGIAFEIDRGFAKLYNSRRKSHCFCTDATKVDFRSIFHASGMPKTIDYLQLDIEPAENTLSALRRIPFDEFRFSVITFEHDLYRDAENLKVQEQAFELLNAEGYVRVVQNVKYRGMPFEDWYVDPMTVTKNLPLEGPEAGQEFEKLFQAPRTSRRVRPFL